MTPAEQTLIDSLWEKYASSDRHGYKDLMRSDGFEAACAELIAAIRGGAL